MSHFRTIVSISPSDNKIGLKSGVFTIGSCFADAIGSRLEQSKFNVEVNSFGISYNPLSIHEVLIYALRNEKPPENTYLIREDVHLNYNFHSSLSALDRPTLVKKISDTIESSHEFLKYCEYALITYGTAWVYRENENKKVVNNCHKIPASHFTKSLIEETEIVESFQKLYSETKKINRRLKFILTLSPVRHLKDTLQLNSVSKAVLRSACHAIQRDFPDAEYFPAYEIMVDELRDYRFYKSDMLHPTEEAEDYIWKKFLETYSDSDTQRFVNEWSALRSALAHKPFHPRSHSHQNFLRQTLKKLLELQLRVNVDAEIAAVRSQLTDS